MKDELKEEILKEKFIHKCVLEYHIESRRNKIVNEVFYNENIPMIKIDEGWYRLDLANYIYNITYEQEGIRVLYRKRNSRYETYDNNCPEWDCELNWKLTRDMAQIERPVEGKEYCIYCDCEEMTKGTSVGSTFVNGCDKCFSREVEIPNKKNIRIFKE